MRARHDRGLQVDSSSTDRLATGIFSTDGKPMKGGGGRGGESARPAEAARTISDVASGTDSPEKEPGSNSRPVALIRHARRFPVSV
jgi:hypothetical protein